MRNKKLLLAVLLVVLVGGGAGAWWYASVPHTPEAAFAVAEEAERKAKAEADAKKPEARAAAEQAIERFRYVGRFGKTPKHAEALDRIATLQEKHLKDYAAAIKTLEDLAKNYADDVERGGGAVVRAAQIHKKQAEALKADGKADEANKKFEEAIAKFEEYEKGFARGPRVDETLLETGRIWQEGIGSPLIKAIAPLERLTKEFPGSSHKPEAMFRLGKLYETAQEFEKALEIYAQLADEFPKSKWAEDALWARGNLLKDKLAREDEAAKDLKRLAEEHPDSPLAGQAKAAAEEAEGKAAVKESDNRTKSRYGGSMPVDTVFDKPVPPWEELKRFAAQKLDAQKYDLNVEIAPADHRITVTGTLSLVNRGDEKGKELLFMLANGFTITRVTVDGEAARHRLEGETLEVTVPKPIKPEQAFTMAFEYSGQFSGPMNEHDGAEEGEERIIEMKDGTKKKFRAVNEPPGRPGRGHRMNAQLAIGKYGYGLSGGAWYPVTVLGDLFDARTAFSVPSGVEAVASGAVSKREPGAAGKKGDFVFTTAKPVFGLYFAYGDYRYEERTVGGVKYHTYLTAGNAGKSAAYVEVASRILNFYGEKFTPFAYEKMAIVETPLPPFLGGVGPSSMMMLNKTMVDQKDPPEFLLAHELAHQWFGNLIPINIADPGYSQWLSEGFATYCDALYTEKQLGHEAFVRQMERYSQNYIQLWLKFAMRMKEKPVVRDCSQATPLYRPVVYEKGAFVLHSLRKVMGDEKFFALMRKYVETCQNKATTVADFEKLAQELHGKDLAWFFKQWLDEPTFAHWTIKDLVVDPADSRKITLKIEQPHDLVKMPIDITVMDSAGARHVVKDQTLDQKTQDVVFSVPFAPAKVVIDAEYWVLHRPGAGEWPGVKIESATTKKAFASAEGAATRPAKAPAATEKAPVETAPAGK